MNNNGNEKLNSSRDVVNRSVSRYSYMGSGLSKIWNNRRRYRTI
jgi:hypothetical protein